MAWALIIDGAVHQVTTDDPAGRFPPDMNWQECQADTQERWSAVEDNGAWSFAAPAAPVMSLADARVAQNADILAVAQAALAEVVAAYPDLEVATWPQQLAEAAAYTASSSAATPMLAAISAASGETIAALAVSIMAKADAFQTAAGAVIGKRIALMSKISAATKISSVQAVTWE